MEIYLYCTYAGSRNGYVLTKLHDGCLVRAEQIVPAMVGDFFSYDRFRVLWMEGRSIPRLAEKAQRWMERSEQDENIPRLAEKAETGTKTLFFGARGLRGSMPGGRSVTSNIALLAEEGEEHCVRQAALAVIGDWNRFEKILSGMLSVGGDAGYELDSGAFFQWMQDCPSAGALQRRCGMFSLPAHVLSGAVKAERAGIKGVPKISAVRNPVKFAVCTCSWENARSILGDAAGAGEKPGCVIDSRRFTQEFAEKAPLWE